MDAERIVQFLDEYLQIRTVEDESNNGLQVEGPEKVKKIGFSVDACMDVFTKARDGKCSMIVVHHGLMWGSLDYIRGDIFRRVKFLMENGIALYAAHLPLDIHKEVGNNVQLASLLGLEVMGDFFQYRNTKLGLLCRADESLDALTNKVKETLGQYTVLKFGKDHVRRVGIITGAGTMGLNAAAEIGCDTFITGEARHRSYHLAKESGMNVIFAGHYRTETLGVRALMEKINKEFKVETVFIDVPTGL